MSICWVIVRVVFGWESEAFISPLFEMNEAKQHQSSKIENKTEKKTKTGRSLFIAYHF